MYLELSEVEKEKLRKRLPDARLKDRGGGSYKIRGASREEFECLYICTPPLVTQEIRGKELKIIKEKELPDMSWEQAMKQGIANDIKAEITPVKEEVIKDINQSKAELKQQIEDARKELKQLKQLDERLRAVENLGSITVLINKETEEKKEKKRPIVTKIENLESRIDTLEKSLERFTDFLVDLFKNKKQ